MLKMQLGLKPPRIVYSALAFRNAVAEPVRIWSKDWVFCAEP